KTIDKDRPRYRLHASAARALDHPKEDKHRQRRGHSAEKRAERKNHNAREEKSLAPKKRGEPSGERQDDRIRHQVGSENPGALVHSRREAAGDVRQRYVGDAG